MFSVAIFLDLQNVLAGQTIHNVQDCSSYDLIRSVTSFVPIVIYGILTLLSQRSEKAANLCAL